MNWWIMASGSEPELAEGQCIPAMGKSEAYNYRKYKQNKALREVDKSPMRKRNELEANKKSRLFWVKIWSTKKPYH